MSSRFNAPPGWQVPEGFVPPQGWQPDPSWPPAPHGWEFWPEEEGSNYGEGPQVREATTEQILQAKLAERRSARTQIITGLLMFVVAIVIFFVTDTIYYIIGIVGAISALAGVFGYLKADRAVRTLSAPQGMAGTLGGVPGPTNTPGTSYGSGGVPPNITKVSTHLKNDDGTMPGQWKV